MNERNKRTSGLLFHRANHAARLCEPGSIPPEARVRCSRIGVLVPLSGPDLVSIRTPPTLQTTSACPRTRRATAYLVRRARESADRILETSAQSYTRRKRRHRATLTHRLLPKRDRRR